MKLKFKRQDYQTESVASVIDCFIGQPYMGGAQYRVEPGELSQIRNLDGSGSANHEITLTSNQLLKNIQAVQARHYLPISQGLERDNRTGFVPNLVIEMETGTGKTYCYIKTIFELNRRYGWSKFIIVVPSIAIREGVAKSLEITAEHFLEDYQKRANFFIYNSKTLSDLESFSSNAGIHVMIINVQAFNVTGKDARRIHEELDEFQSRKPIDVIKSTRPIMILDEPQIMEGDKTIESLKTFNPLMILRYSATHKKEYNKIYRLDALDAYQKKLVKKISVCGISVRGIRGSNSYLYLESIDISRDKPPVARIEMVVKHKTLKRINRLIGKNDNLFELSKMDAYKGFLVTDINANTQTLHFSNGEVIKVGEVLGDPDELMLRRIQIQETIKAHFEKEQNLFHKGIKVLSLFFIDEVAKYRCYDAPNGDDRGEYAKIFEEEYDRYLNQILQTVDGDYKNYLERIEPFKTHDGYFSKDKKSQRLTNPPLSKKTGETDDVSAYDLILKEKERLLLLSPEISPVRFIFSHSALREGWDNPNVFVICALKHSDNSVSRRQEVGRGMRLAVNQHGERTDDPTTVHETNVLTVVANESYTDFVTALQKNIKDSLSSRPKIADTAYFLGKQLHTENGIVKMHRQLAVKLENYLFENEYVNESNYLTPNYVNAKIAHTLAPLPEELKPYTDQIWMLLDTILSDDIQPVIEDERLSKLNKLNANFHKKEFQSLWKKINRKAIYTVQFDSNELIKKSITALNEGLKVAKISYVIERGIQNQNYNTDDLAHGKAFQLNRTETPFDGVVDRSGVKYDLIGKLTTETNLTRKTIAHILQGIDSAVFEQYQQNPEDFILKAAKIIQDQKAAVVVEHLTYDALAGSYDSTIFTHKKIRQDLSKAEPVEHHIYDYVFTDSDQERKFVKELDKSAEVIVYAKLPRDFYIPTPVGKYTPDWAIAFNEGSVKHVYFIAETKGSLDTMELRRIEDYKVKCARKYFKKLTSDQVKYDVINDYDQLMQLVR
ncbi:type III restriction-modification system endonuclease [Legionella pneumophila]|uniref:type III restriction-modification system endonuclease n=1 Tax=Legionella pneumophila TaxID=446 RepID=UPI000875EC92|nr:DEAD/DEAH box helicase family protein [Legionella pneumophila]AOW59002.1 restriction endonuclease subunit R [Legionella pneumophila subsp. pneumophila]AOW60810.1 restriction endonuclease subunit R [Legionella pneumophila subsp. pneumophila]AOW66208.1 restriction endonuclease subunit R [Legionella pneumophila subsp. pneumophila]